MAGWSSSLLMAIFCSTALHFHVLCSLPYTLIIAYAPHSILAAPHSILAASCLPPSTHPDIWHRSSLLSSSFPLPQPHCQPPQHTQTPQLPQLPVTPQLPHPYPYY